MRSSSSTIGAIALLAAFVSLDGCGPQPEFGSSGSGGTSVGFGEGSVVVATGQSFASVSIGSGGSMGLPPPLWSRAYGDTADQQAARFVVSAAGECALAGSAAGTIDFGNIPFSGAQDADAVVAKLDSTGKSKWSRRYGDASEQHGTAVALDPSGNLLLAGDFTGKMDFGSTDLATAKGDVDAFVVLLDTLGDDIYSRRFGGTGAQLATGAALDSNGNAIIVGSFQTSFDAGTGAVASAGLDDVFVIKLDKAGKLVWSQTFGGPGADLARAVAVDAKGNVIIGGSFSGTTDFGGGPLTTNAGATGAFLLALDPSGNHLWSRTFGDPDASVINSVAIDDVAQAIVITGSFAGTANFDGGPVVSAGASDIFVARLDSSGAATWAHTYGGAAAQSGDSIAIGPTGDITFAGTSEEPIVFQPATSAVGTEGAGMAFVVQLFADGSTTSLREAFSGNTSKQVAGVGEDGMTDVILAGSFQDSLQTMYGPIEGAGGWDIFVRRVR